MSTSDGRKSMWKLSSTIACGLVEHDVGIRVEADIGPDTQGMIATVSGVSCAVLVPCKYSAGSMQADAQDRGAARGENRFGRNEISIWGENFGVKGFCRICQNFDQR